VRHRETGGGRTTGKERRGGQHRRAFRWEARGPGDPSRGARGRQTGF
jgi:hypothetical protein